MVQALIAMAIIGIAVFLGQSNPVLGGLIAMFPVKMFTYVLASDPGRAPEGMWGVLIGSSASTACAVVMWLTIKLGTPISLCAGLLSWSIIAFLGRFVASP
jgi:hypothetical protein